MAGSSTKCPFMGGVGLRGFDCILILLFVVMEGMVMKPGKVLYCMLLSAVLGLAL